MGLINCEACGKSISEDAQACPNCGHPNKSKSVQEIRVKTTEDNFMTRNRGLGDIAIFVPLIVILFIIIFAMF